MNLITSPGDDNLKALARRLFKLRGRRAEIDERVAVDALRAANPHIRADKPIRAGTLVVVPDVRGLTRAAGAEAVSPAAEPQTRTVELLSDALGRVKKHLADDATEEKKRIVEMLVSLKKNAAALRGADEEVAERLKEIKDSSLAQQKELEEHAKRTISNVAQLHKHVDKLAKALSGG